MFINFEKRQNNIEKVKELYFKAFQAQLNMATPQSQNHETLNFIVVQYARYLCFKCSEHSRAIDILNQAIQKINFCNK